MFAADTKAGGQPSSAMPSARIAWKEIVEPVTPFLDQVARRLVEQVDAFDPEISSYARYALTNQGKQLRPVLVALSADATGGLNDSLVTAATIIEMVHLATLVHDDVMDEASVRRCRPTMAANWGNQISVLLGDCLFAQALHLAASFPTPEVCRVVSAATKAVCSGEIYQTHHRRNFKLGREQYFRILQMKTGELFALSCDLGGKLSGASQSQRNALRQYGLLVGTAYQIYDDCVDIFGSEARSGKSLGTDLASGKLTLPLLIALERSSVADREELCACLQQWDAKFFPFLRAVLDKYDAQNESRAVIHAFLGSARRELEILPDSRSRAGLNGLAQFLSEQTDSLGVLT